MIFDHCKGLMRSLQWRVMKGWWWKEEGGQGPKWERGRGKLRGEEEYTEVNNQSKYYPKNNLHAKINKHRINMCFSLQLIIFSYFQIITKAFLLFKQNIATHTYASKFVKPHVDLRLSRNNICIKYRHKNAIWHNQHIVKKCIHTSI